jgi:hypothetical protein
MFLDSSRYSGFETVDARTRSGRSVKAVRLRRLPTPDVVETVIVKEHDRLDIIAQRRYANPTLFWHIADANTALDAAELTREVGALIDVPEQ